MSPDYEGEEQEGGGREAAEAANGEEHTVDGGDGGCSSVRARRPRAPVLFTGQLAK